MKLRFGLFLAASVTVGVIAAACGPKNNNDNGTLPGNSPTPTQTTTGTPTPAPGVTPGIKPFESWVTPDGKELWLGFEMTGAIQSITKIATRAVTCTSAQVGLSITGTSGAFHHIRFENKTTPLNCANTGHNYYFDFQDGDNGCTSGCVNDFQQFSFPANSAFGGTGTGVFNTVDVYDDPNDPADSALLMYAKNSSTFTYTVTEERIYTTGHIFVAECDVPFTAEPNANPAIVQVCATNPGITAGNYTMMFGGTVNGTEAFQTIDFTYHGTYPP